MKVKFFDKLFLIYLVITLTHLGVAVCYYTETREMLKFYGACEVVFLTVVLFIHRRYLLHSISTKGTFLILLFLFLIWPITTMLWAPTHRMRELALQILFFQQILSAILAVRLFQWKVIAKVCFFSFLITCIAIIASWLFPSYFIRLVDDASFAGRAFGLYGQPNRAGTALTLYFFIWFSGYVPKFQISRLLWFMIAIFTVLVTGSRGSLLVFVATTAIFLFIEIKGATRIGRMLSSGFRTFGRYVVSGLILLVLLGVSFPIWSDSALGEQVDNKLNSAIERVTTLFEENVTETDASISSRIAIIKVYIDGSLDKPLLGHGLFANQVYIFLGRLPLAAHNTFLHVMHEFGIPYLLVLLLFYGFIFKKLIMFPRSQNPGILPFAPITAFVAFLLLQMLSNTILCSRYSVLAFGLLISIVWNQRMILGHYHRSMSMYNLRKARPTGRLYR